MTRLHAKLIVAATILVAAAAYLAYAGIKTGCSYYLQVDSFLADPQYRTRHVRLHGTVGAEGLEVAVEGALARFQLLGEKGKVPVVYRGTIPDLFRAGCEVVVEGRMDDGGLFRAEQLLTKCASKYARKGAGTGKP